MARLFNALVALGAGMSASSCGGEVGGTGRTGEGGAGGTTAGSGSSTSSGGTTTVATGGISFGGFTAAGGAASGGAGSLPDPGTLAQWNCDGFFDYCDSSDPLGGRHVLSQACPVEPTRPRTWQECPSGTVFECTAARWTNGEDIEVNCACAPSDVTGGCDCVAVDGSILPAQCTARTRTCFCAFTGILR